MSFGYWILIIVLGAAFGSSFFFNEILLRELGPLSISAARVGLGAMAVWAFVFATGRFQTVTRRQLAQFAILGIGNYAIPFAMLAFAQQSLTGGVTGIVNALTPVMVILLSLAVFGGESITRTKTAGVVFGFAGIVILAMPALQAGGHSELWAIVIAICAPLGYGFGTNYARRLKKVDPFLLTAFAQTGAAFAIAPIALLWDGMPVIEAPTTFASLAVAGFVVTGGGFMMIFWLLPRVGATVASTVTFIAPISAVLLGAAILGEAVTSAQLAGMAVILAGLALIDGRVVGLLRIAAVSMRRWMKGPMPSHA